MRGAIVRGEARDEVESEAEEGVGGQWRDDSADDEEELEPDGR